MTPSDLQDFMRREMPLADAMQASVLALDAQHALLAAPLAPNLNHHGTLFGGSGSAIAILAAWALLYARVQSTALDCSLVIRRNTMDYLAPVTGPFLARAVLADADGWDSFVAALARKGKARISVAVALESDQRVAGQLVAEFVGMRPGASGVTHT